MQSLTNWGRNMNPTLLDIYSRETFRDVGAVCRTYNKFEYSPIVFVYEKAFQTVCSVGVDMTKTPLIAAYMLNLLQKASEKREEIYPNFLAYIWRTGNDILNN